MLRPFLQAESPEDWVIATGRTTTIREFVKMAFNHIGVELEFKGTGLKEVAKVKTCLNIFRTQKLLVKTIRLILREFKRLASK